MSSLQKFDMFSLPFFFNLYDNQKTRKTKFGGIISIMIILIALIYFSYLLYLYFGNQINPSFSQNEQFLNQSFSMNVTNDFLAFKLNLKSGQTLVQMQKEMGLVYLNVIAQYIVKSTIPNQKPDIKNLKLVACEDPQLSDYNCLDFTPINQNKLEMPFQFDNKFLGRYSIVIQLILCDQKLLEPNQKCASPQQIRQEILNLETQGIMRIKIQQYDPSEQKYVQKVKHEIFSFNDFICNISQITLQQAVTKVNRGFIIQGEDQNTYFYDFQRTHFSNTISFMNEELGFQLVNYIQIYIGNSGITQVIQYPQFTYFLAQFTSLLNTLLIVGILCKVFSQNQILQDFVDIQIKNYYKKTAWILLKNQNKNKVWSQNNIPFKHFSQIHFQIQNMNFKQQIDKYLNLSYFEKLKLQLIDSNNVEKQDKDKQEIKIYKELVKQTQKHLSIAELQKEIMNIKIIQRLLLSVEQYAAIQLCGYSIINENTVQDKDSKTAKLAKDQNCKKIQKEHFDLFLQNQQNGKVNTESQEIIQNNGQILHNKSDEPLKDNSNSEQKQNLKVEKEFNKQIHKQNSEVKYKSQKKQIQLQMIKKQVSNEMNNENIDLVDKNYLNNNQPSQVFQNNLQYSIIKDHLEKIDLVDSDQNYFEKCLENFFQKNHQKSELDKRILGCIIGYDQETLEKSSDA
ncbi:hypothetical protein ABPG74_009618 [Tetrahymena malaccensis]